jgi:hypothetical protein
MTRKVPMTEMGMASAMMPVVTEGAEEDDEDDRRDAAAEPEVGE